MIVLVITVTGSSIITTTIMAMLIVQSVVTAIVKIFYLNQQSHTANHRYQLLDSSDRCHREHQL